MVGNPVATDQARPQRRKSGHPGPEQLACRRTNGSAYFADPAPYQTQWHYRWALPLGCLITVLLATPLGIYFSRRGAGGGVFLAVILSGLMLLLTSISVALGESGTLASVARRVAAECDFHPCSGFIFSIDGSPVNRSTLLSAACFPAAD